MEINMFELLMFGEEFLEIIVQSNRQIADDRPRCLACDLACTFYFHRGAGRRAVSKYGVDSRHRGRSSRRRREGREGLGGEHGHRRRARGRLRKRRQRHHSGAAADRNLYGQRVEGWIRQRRAQGHHAALG